MHLILGLTLYRLCLSFSSSITISSTSSYVCHYIIPSKIVFLTVIKLKSINPSYLFLSIPYIKKNFFPLYISVITTIDFLHTLIFLPPNDPSCLMHHNPCIKEKWEFSLFSFHHRHGIWFPITIPTSFLPTVIISAAQVHLLSTHQILLLSQISHVSASFHDLVKTSLAQLLPYSQTENRLPMLRNIIF